LKLIDFKNVYFIANKVRNDTDLDYIQKYFWENINFLWSIPFSKDIMKMDIKWNLDSDKLPEAIQNNLDLIVNNILNLKVNKNEVIERLNCLDILKWDKKVH
jgi:CO dehydrogenase nickel-insertion accessory protein CooC1